MLGARRGGSFVRKCLYGVVITKGLQSLANVHRLGDENGPI